MSQNRKSHMDADHPVSTYFQLALPVVMGSIVTILYNLADTYFIAQTNQPLLIAGVSVCSPIFIILMAFGNIFGQGGSSLISRMLGRKDTVSAGRVSAFCFYTALAVGAVIGALMLLVRDPLLHLLGSSQDTLPHARQYGTVLMAGAPLIVVNFIHMNLLRCEGMSGLSMAGTVIGAVINVILDPILIPVSGAAGAAAATIAGYLCSDLFLLVMVLRKSSCLSVRPCFSVELPFLKDILLIGLSAAVTNLASSLCTILINQHLLPFGDQKIAAMGIVLKLVMIVQMILVGFAFGGIPLFGFLIGGGYQDPFRKLLRFCCIFLPSLALAMTLLVVLASEPLMRLMTSNSAIIADGTPMLRWQVAGSVFGSMVMLLTCVYQAAGKAAPAMALSLSRQGILFAAVLLLAVRLAGYTGLIASQCLADFLSFLLALGLFLTVPPVKRQ